MVRLFLLCYLVLIAAAAVYLTTAISNLQTLEHQQKAAAAAVCAATVAARRDSNEHIRKPLRSMLKFVAQLEAQEAKSSQRLTARQRALVLTVERRFTTYADQVKLIPVGCKESP